MLLGSTDKLGVGTNIQTRCVALHHVDAPWRPADVEQREGRALRPGNLNPAVEHLPVRHREVVRLVHVAALERKARFIGQVLGGRPAGRDVDDIGDATLSYAEVKALATGNPLLLELAEVNAEVTRLRQLAAGHSRAARRLTDSVSGWQIQAGHKDKAASEYDRIAAIFARNTDPAWYDDRGRRTAEAPGTVSELRAEAPPGFLVPACGGCHFRRCDVPCFQSPPDRRHIRPVPGLLMARGRHGNDGSGHRT